MVAWTGQKLGFGSSKNILQEIGEDSHRLDDLRHEFTIWLFQQSVPVYCFFEQLNTNYGRRIGLSWSVMVVDEKNACLDGHRKVALPCDHLKLNKFDGPNDEAYLIVCSVVRKIAREEVRKVEERLRPRRSLENGPSEKDLYPLQIISEAQAEERTKCLRELYLTDPADDLASIQRAKGKRMPHTCEWILSRSEYSRWLVEEQVQLLCLTGGPGNGKTMIATFLVEQLESRATQNHQMTFAYYFCDNKVQDRRTSTAVLRGLLFQILKQRPNLFEHVIQQHKEKGARLFENFDALCRIMENVLCDKGLGEAYLMVDALDECEGIHHDDLVNFLSHLSNSACRAKLLVVSRPTIQMQELNDAAKAESYGSILVDSTAINVDLYNFIENAVKNLPRRFSGRFRLEIKEKLKEQAGGTFLWASLVLEDISKASSTIAALARMKTIPKDLDAMYVRILSEIDERDLDDARCVLQCVTAAVRPLTVRELAVSFMIGRGYWQKARLPRDEEITEYKDGWQCCRALLRIDIKHQGKRTVNLVHQSAKDFLLDKKSRINSDPLATCSFYLAEAHLQMFDICRKYLDSTDFDDFAYRMVCGHGDPKDFKNAIPWPSYMLSYYLESFYDHAARAASHIRDHSPWFEDWARKRPTMPGSCMRYAAYSNHFDMVSLLLEKGVDVNSPNGSGITSLRIAVEKRNPEIVQLLLDCPDMNGNRTGSKLETPIFFAVRDANWPMVEQLVRSGKCDLNATDDGIRTVPHCAALDDVSSTVQLLLAQKGIKPDMPDSINRTPLSYAARSGNEACIKLLLSRTDVAIDSQDRFGLTPLLHAVIAVNEACVKLILAQSDSTAVHVQDEHGRTPISYAASCRDQLSLDLLLSRKDAPADTPDHKGRTPLSWAAGHGCAQSVALLLSRSDVIADSRDKRGCTPLSWAAQHLNAQSVALLLSRSDVIADSRDEHGRTPLSFAAQAPFAAQGWHISHTAMDMIDFEVVLRLLLSREDVLPNSFDEEGLSPLMWAAQSGEFIRRRSSPLTDEEQEHYCAAMELLVLKSDSTIDARDYYGRTALSAAAELFNVYLVSILLERSNVSVDAVDNNMMTPLAWVLQRALDKDANHEHYQDLLVKVLERLIHAGANVNDPSVGAQTEAAGWSLEDDTDSHKSVRLSRQLSWILSMLEGKESKSAE